MLILINVPPKNNLHYTENFFEKRLAFTPKMRKLSLTRQAASTKTQTKRKVENIMKTGKKGLPKQSLFTLTPSP